MSFIVSGFHLNLEFAIDDVSFEFIDANTSYAPDIHTRAYPHTQTRTDSWGMGSQETFFRVETAIWILLIRRRRRRLHPPFCARLYSQYGRFQMARKIFMRDNITIKLVNIFLWLRPSRQTQEWRRYSRIDDDGGGGNGCDGGGSDEDDVRS